MSADAEQLLLPVQINDDTTFENFFAGANGLLMQQLEQQLEAGERYIYLYGSAGCGRSHLLQAACQRALNQGHAAQYLPLRELVDYPAEALFESLEQLSLLCLDDLDAVLGKADWEEQLFHLFNRLADAGVALVIAANVAVRELPITLADLMSRLSWGVVHQLKALNDQEQLSLLVFRAGQRGMELSEDVAQFICLRAPRETAALLALLDTLDSASLKEQRKLTVPFVKMVLNW